MDVSDGDDSWTEHATNVDEEPCFIGTEQLKTRTSVSAAAVRLHPPDRSLPAADIYIRKRVINKTDDRISKNKRPRPGGD